MKKLIKMYNEKYGDALGVIDDDFNKEQMYRIYYFIKNNCDDKDIQDRIKMINLDKPKTLEQQLTKLESENGNSNNSDIKKYVDDNTPIKSFPVNPTTKTGAVVVINNITSSGCYALPKRTDGKYWTNLILRVMPSDGSGKGKAIMLNGYQNYVFHVNIDTKKIYCDNLRIVYSIGASDDTTDINTEPYFLPTTNTKEYTPTTDYHPATKKYVDDNRNYYFKVPTILYDDPNLPKGYVDITTLEQGTNYRVNSSIVSGFFKVSLKAPNDDGTWFTVDDGSNTIGWSSMLSTSICVQLKSDTFIAINMNCINNYCKYLSITKENGKWKLMQTKLNSISPDNMYEYDVTNDYNPTHKKYVDDKVSSLPQLSFNESGELVVTINGVSKTFVPKSE